MTSTSEHATVGAPTKGESSPRKPLEIAEIRAIVEPLVEEHGVDLENVVWSNGPAGRILRVTIEHPEDADELLADLGVPDLLQQAGIGLEQCVRVSRTLSEALDAHEERLPPYNLEVSSPGVDRALRSERDFRRQLGRTVKVKLHEAAPDGQMVLRGLLRHCADGRLGMTVDGNDHSVALSNVREARVVFEFGPAKQSVRKGKRGKGKRRKSNDSRPNASSVGTRKRPHHPSEGERRNQDDR